VKQKSASFLSCPTSRRRLGRNSRGQAGHHLDSRIARWGTQTSTAL